MKQNLIFDTCPAGMSEAFAIHALDVVNHIHEDLRVKKSTWQKIKDFAAGQNALFRGDHYVDVICLLPVYRDYLAEHPGRSFYATPQFTFNGIQLGEWIDRTKKTLGRNRAFEWFRENGFFHNHNIPTDEMIANGWMREVTGRRINVTTPLFTPSGVAHFAPIIASDFYFLGLEQL